MKGEPIYQGCQTYALKSKHGSNKDSPSCKGDRDVVLSTLDGLHPGV